MRERILVEFLGVGGGTCGVALVFFRLGEIGRGLGYRFSGICHRQRATRRCQDQWGKVHRFWEIRLMGWLISNLRDLTGGYVLWRGCDATCRNRLLRRPRRLLWVAAATACNQFSRRVWKVLSWRAIGSGARARGGSEGCLLPLLGHCGLQHALGAIVTTTAA